MVNSQVVKEIVDALKLDMNIEKVPSPVPVIEVNPKLVKNVLLYNSTRNVSGAATILTTPTNQDYYLHGIEFDYTKDASCDMASGRLSISVVIGGATYYVASFSVLTLTAQYSGRYIQFKTPLKLDRNSAIRFNGATFTAGNLIQSVCLHYMIDET